MAALFPPDRSLLHPQFETYRLHPLDPSTDVTSYPLPGGGATQSRVGYNTHHLSFKETRARIAWDHLAVQGKRGVYVDVDWNIIGFTIGDDLRPTFTTLATLPIPISSSAFTQHPEYPSVLPLSGTIWLISSGTGSLYVLRASPAYEPFSGSLIARYDLDTQLESPFILHSAHLVSDSKAKILVTRSIPAPADGLGLAGKQTTAFELLEATLDPSKSNGVDNSSQLEDMSISWTLKGGDIPVWTKWIGDGWVVLSSETFGKSSNIEEEESETEREKRERRDRIEKLGLGASLPPSNSDEKDEGMDLDVDTPVQAQSMDERQWPFSWTQTSDSLSVAIPLPQGITRNDIRIAVSATTFSLSLSPSSSPSPTLSSFLAKPSRSFWTAIDPSTSTFSYNDRKSLLELEISKVDLNTRWPSVFSPPDDNDHDEEDEEVPETLSADILASVRETFSNIKTRTGDEPTGNHPAIPALLREEMDYDLEDGEDFGENPTGVFGEPGGGGKVGRDIFVGYIKSETGAPTWSKSQSSVISLPLTGEGIMIKSAVDGLLFTPPTPANPVKTPWVHTTTSPALSFVLSSKRDLRLVRHVVEQQGGTGGGATVLAFDAGGSSAASGNVYVYYPPSPGVATGTARQGVVRVSGAERGAILGTGAVDVAGKQVVVALCEKELVVLNGVLGAEA